MVVWMCMWPRCLGASGHLGVRGSWWLRQQQSLPRCVSAKAASGGPATAAHVRQPQGCHHPPTRSCADSEVPHHPDLGGAAHLAVLGEHPAVVGEQHLQGVAHGDDEGHPQAGAEQDATDHVLRPAGQVAAAETRPDADP